MSEHKLRPSRNRGPGALTRDQAGILRNELSQAETQKKKRKIEAVTAIDAGVGLRSVNEELAGSGGIKSGFLEARNKFSPKGRAIGPVGQTTLSKVFGGQPVVNGAEAMCVQLMPKYGLGPGNAVGTNNCPKVYNTKQSTALGLMDQLRCPTNPARGGRLADLGVTTINLVEGELTQQNIENWLAQQAAASAAAGGGAAGAAAAAAIPAPAPPTIDEVKAAIQLSVLYGWTNRNQAPGARRAVTKTRDVQGL